MTVACRPAVILPLPVVQLSYYRCLSSSGCVQGSLPLRVVQLSSPRENGLKKMTSGEEPGLDTSIEPLDPCDLQTSEPLDPCDLQTSEPLDHCDLQTSEPLDHCDLQTRVSLQLSEVDMLQSMFPGPGELVVDDPTVLCDLRDFAEGLTRLLPPHLEFVINLDVDKGQCSVSVNLPHLYPAVPPRLFVRSQTLSREAQHRLNQDLLTYMKTIQEGDLCIGPAVTWLQEKGGTFFEDYQQMENAEQVSVETKDDRFARLWIYSHHIYSKVKRKDILDLSRDFDLTGFCLPGKPGIMCVEGLAQNTEDWWHKVRSWNWQKILCKKREEVNVSSDQDLSTLRRFSTFEELGSENNIRVKSGGFHVNMGDVFRYLDDHDCGYVFKDYFGISGRPT